MKCPFSPSQKPTEYLPLLDRAVSQELRNLIRDLLSGSVNTVNALVLATADHVYDNLDAADTLARHLERHALNVISFFPFSPLKRSCYTFTLFLCLRKFQMAGSSA